MNEKQTKWAQRWVAMADLVATWSSDPSTKCGAVIVDDESNTVLAVGYNDLPRGVEDTEDKWERPEKYEWVEHGERNAIYNAARTGVNIKGATMYLNYAVECCTNCARAIIQSGIERVVGPEYREFPGKGKRTHYDTQDVGEELRLGFDVEHVEMPNDHMWLTKPYITENKDAV